MKGLSKFRNATVQAADSNKRYNSVGLAEVSPYSPSIACSDKFIATTAISSGKIAVLPTDISKHTAKGILPTISAHADIACDFSFSPFNPHLLATAGDEVLRGWKIPASGLADNLTSPEFQIGEMAGQANALQWHPLVEGVVAVGCKSSLCVCDIEASKKMCEMEIKGSGKDIISVGWDYYGKVLGCVGKDYQLYCADPRAGGGGLKGIKPSAFRPQRVLFMGKGGRMIVTGVSSSRQPVIQIYDPRKLSTSLLEQDLNLAPGYMMANFDTDTRLLSVTMRGSSVVQLYDVTKSVKRGEMKQINQKMFGSNTFSGVCAAPKYSLDLTKSEVMRLYTRDSSSVAPISVRVPRKINGFHEELYPDTLSNKPSRVGIKEWFGGKDPVVTLVPVTESLSNFRWPSPSGEGADEQEKKEKGGGETSGGKDKGDEETKEQKKASFMEATAVRKKIDCALKRTAFVHLNGTQTSSSHRYYYDIQPGRAVAMHRNIDINEKYILFPWKTTGGSGVAILERGRQMGRLGDLAKLRGHTDQVTAFALSRVSPTLCATGSLDGLVKVFNLPDKPSGDVEDAKMTLTCSGKVLGIQFHPGVADVLLTYSIGHDGCDMRLWNLKGDCKSEEVLVDVHGEAEVMFASFNIKGNLIATTAKDGKVRIIDPRNNKVMHEFAIAQGQRDAFVYFMDDSDELVAVLGFTKGGTREIGIYNVATGKCLKEMEVEGDSAAMMPHFDLDTKLLYVASAGFPSVQFFLLSTEAPFVEQLSRFKSQHDFKGFVMAPKVECDVRKVEVNVGWQLAKNEIKSISFKVPRKRAEFFQDDLFVPTASPAAFMGSVEWFSQKHAEKEGPVYVSLQPNGMVPLSEAPEEKLTERQMKYQQRKEEAKAPKAKGFLGHESDGEVRQHFKQLAQLMDTNSNPWDAQGEDQEDSDWSD